MRYEIVRAPFMLLETMNMLYKYVNGISFHQLLATWKNVAANPKNRRMVARCRELQKIMEQVCGDLDPQDPLLLRFFGQVEHMAGATCLAEHLTLSFLTLEKPDFQEHVQEILQCWRRIQGGNFWLRSDCHGMLMFTNTGDHPGELIYQVQNLNYPPEFRLELCATLTRFEENLLQMAELMEPVSRKLEEAYRARPWMLQDIWDYWEELMPEVSPLDMLHKALKKPEVDKDSQEVTTMAFSLMNTHTISSVAMEDMVYAEPRLNCMYVGGALTPEFYAITAVKNLDDMSAVLKYISDRKRLELLRVLSRERSYGHSLAEATGIHTGNISRTLATLHQYGFLKQEKGPWRTWYETDREALHDFLVRLEEAICQ